MEDAARAAPRPEATSNDMKLLIIIVNYRTAGLTIECLASLAPEVASIRDARVLVVDNASGDGSADTIAEAIEARGFGPWAELLPSPWNGGFAYGNNLAALPALSSDDPPEYIHLLNPDTVVMPGAVRSLVAFLDTHPRAGIAGSRLESPQGDIFPAAFRFYSLASEFEHAIAFGPVSRLLAHAAIKEPLTGTAQPVGWVCGASMMIRAEVFERAGAFDEEYFLYYEEADFCLQSHRAGFECWHVPESHVVHVLSASTLVLRDANRKPPYWFASRRRYFVKNHGRAYTLAANLLFASGFLLQRIRRALLGQEMEASTLR